MKNLNILTNEDTLETLYIIKNFPVSMSCVNISFQDYKYLDMEVKICNKTGIIQIVNLPSLEDIYITPHNLSQGVIWNNLFEIMYSKINTIINLNNINNILEIGGGSLLLASKLLKNENIKKYIVYEKNSTKKYTEDQRIELKLEYFTNETDIIKNPDLIIHSHVIEHVWNPNDFIKKINSFTNNNGYHCFIVPNLKIQYLNKFGNSFNFEHNILLTEDYIDIILNNNNFDIIEKEYYLDHSIIYITKKSEKNIKILEYPNMYYENKELGNNFYQYYQDSVKELNIKINNFNGDIYLFGGHIFSQYLIYFGLDIKKIKGILDNSPEKNNCKLYGTELIISNPLIIKNINVAVIVRAASYQNEIIEQLKKINNNVIIF